MLPAQEWRGTIIPFTVGVLGSLDQAIFHKNLGIQGVPQQQRQHIAKAVITVTLAGLERMFLAQHDCWAKKIRL
jgi:hypothetical protein